VAKPKQMSDTQKVELLKTVIWKHYKNDVTYVSVHLDDDTRIDAPLRGTIEETIENAVKLHL